MCELCKGTGRVYVESPIGVQINPCPKCNKAYRKRKGYE